MSTDENTSAPVTTPAAAAFWLAHCSNANCAEDCAICPYKDTPSCCDQLMADAATVITEMIGG